MEVRSVSGAISDFVETLTEYNRDSGQTVPNQTGAPQRIPGRSVTVSNTTYHIHPVAHGYKWIDEPDQDVESVVQEFVKHVDGDVFMEDQTASHFGLSESDVRETDDKRWMQREHPADALKRNSINFARVASGGIIGKRVVDEFRRGYLEALDGDLDPDDERFLELRRALEDPEALSELEDTWRDYGPESGWRDGITTAGYSDTAMEGRSERMADYLVHESASDEVHAIVGAAHYSQVLSRLEKYRDGELSKDDDFQSKRSYEREGFAVSSGLFGSLAAAAAGQGEYGAAAVGAAVAVFYAREAYRAHTSA